MVRENTQRKEEFITPDDLNDRVELDQSSSENEGPQADVEDSQDTVEAGGEILAVAHEVNVLEDALKEAARVFVERVAQYADQTAVTGGMPRGDVVPIHELRQRQELKTAISNLNLTTEQAATLLRGAVENVAPGVGNPSIAEGATEACGEAIAALEDPSVSPDGVSESADKASESAEEVAEHLDEVGEKLNEMAEEEKGEGSGTGVLDMKHEEKRTVTIGGEEVTVQRFGDLIVPSKMEDGQEVLMPTLYKIDEEKGILTVAGEEGEFSPVTFERVEAEGDTNINLLDLEAGAPAEQITLPDGTAAEVVRVGDTFIVNPLDANGNPTGGEVLRLVDGRLIDDNNRERDPQTLENKVFEMREGLDVTAMQEGERRFRTDANGENIVIRREGNYIVVNQDGGAGKPIGDTRRYVLPGDGRLLDMQARAVNPETFELIDNTAEGGAIELGEAGLVDLRQVEVGGWTEPFQVQQGGDRYIVHRPAENLLRLYTVGLQNGQEERTPLGLYEIQGDEIIGPDGEAVDVHNLGLEAGVEQEVSPTNALELALGESMIVTDAEGNRLRLERTGEDTFWYYREVTNEDGNTAWEHLPTDVYQRDGERIVNRDTGVEIDPVTLQPVEQEQQETSSEAQAAGEAVQEAEEEAKKVGVFEALKLGVAGCYEWFVKTPIKDVSSTWKNEQKVKAVGKAVLYTISRGGMAVMAGNLINLGVNIGFAAYTATYTANALGTAAHLANEANIAQAVAGRAATETGSQVAAAAVETAAPVATTESVGTAASAVEQAATNIGTNLDLVNHDSVWTAMKELVTTEGGALEITNAGERARFMENLGNPDSALANKLEQIMNVKDLGAVKKGTVDLASHAKDLLKLGAIR